MIKEKLEDLEHVTSETLHCFENHLDLHKRRGRSLLKISLTLVPAVPLVAVCVYSVVQLVRIGQDISTDIDDLLDEVNLVSAVTSLSSAMFNERASLIYALNLVQDCLQSADWTNADSSKIKICRDILLTNRALADSRVLTDGILFSDNFSGVDSPQYINLTNRTQIAVANIRNTTTNFIWNADFNDYVNEISYTFLHAILEVVFILPNSFQTNTNVDGKLINYHLSLTALVGAEVAIENQFILGLEYLSKPVIEPFIDLYVSVIGNDSILATQLLESIQFSDEAIQIYKTLYEENPLLTGVVSNPEAAKSLYKQLLDQIMAEISSPNNKQLKVHITKESWNEEFREYRTLLDLIWTKLVTDMREKVLNPARAGQIRLAVFYAMSAIIQLPIAMIVWEDALLTVKNVEGYSRVSKASAKDIQVEHEKAESLLEQMLPRSVLEKLKRGESVAAQEYESATIYFSDVVDFHEHHADSEIAEMISSLNSVFNLLDSLIESYDVYKLETIGDIYVVVSGVPVPNGDKHVTEIANMSLEIRQAALTFETSHGKPLILRIGIHTGRIVAGVVGNKNSRYCLFGDTINTASRMQSHGLPSKIHISEPTYKALLKTNSYLFENRGPLTVKGKGTMETYFLLGKTFSTPQQQQQQQHPQQEQQPLQVQQQQQQPTVRVIDVEQRDANANI